MNRRPLNIALLLTVAAVAAGAVGIYLAVH